MKKSRAKQIIREELKQFFGKKNLEEQIQETNEIKAQKIIKGISNLLKKAKEDFK